MTGRARVEGRRVLVGTLLQHCQWRAWQKARAERVGALTILKGTRASVKRCRALRFAHARDSARLELLRSLGALAYTPPAEAVLRPLVKKQLPGGM